MSDAKLYCNAASKRAGLMTTAPAYMDEDGVPIRRIKLLRPMTYDLFEQGEFAKSNWQEIDDANFEQLWQAEVDAVPEFTTSKITLICGLLLPIWDRLPADNMRIYRLQAEDGERAIGRLVSQEQLINVYARLGLDGDIQMEPNEVLRAVMETRATFSLVNGFQLRRSLIMGQPRFELIGASGAILAELKTMGCFTEVIQWKTRVFLPSEARDVLASLLARFPVGTTMGGASQ